ncbi:peptidase domain-containing ABC transporter [Ktedonospora formicarum]|uniref:NHLP family bacteriocin export ABC transporter peptidase/permease/ATPase n=1 Tax=Ktedonospora formicarum TaxID=2778364 RepID=A0A8J3I4Q9_9CHLR|nr:peptidase domain-containing ABC transporter [Ktedonospora formicarum]GHO45394.1 NHLP family bacteriocin export ABC transporter peptidase/permease/ATPase [Ktedonospora formicarum]
MKTKQHKRQQTVSSAQEDQELSQTKRSPWRLWKGRITPQLQANEMECGLTCLGMILNYYGRKTTITELRSRFGVGRDGVSALSIVRAARDYGLRVRAVSLQSDDFKAITLPAIVHWEFKHFLIVEKWNKNYVEVVDPAQGRRRLTKEAFDESFTGIVIMLEPGVDFSQQGSTSPLSLVKYLGMFIKQTPGTLMQVFGASVLMQSLGLILPILTKVIMDQILPFKLVDMMQIIALGMVLLLLSQIVVSLLREWLLVYLRARLDTHMMLGLFEHLMSLPYSFFQQRSTGDLLSRLTSNVTIREALSNQLLSSILDGCMVIVYVFILYWQSPAFCISTLVIGLVQVVFVVATYPVMRNISRQDLTAQGRSQGYLTETVTGIATLKAAGAEEHALERWANLFFTQLNISTRRSYVSAVVGTTMTTLRSLSSLLLLWIGAQQVLNGSLSIGTMLALNSLATSFLGPLTSLVGSMQQLQSIQANFERISDIIITEPEQNRRIVAVPPRLTGRIHLEDVSFRYNVGSPEVLRNLKLTIKSGQKVAIVGRTGSGKSTLGKLILGLNLPTGGHIIYDGMPLECLNYQEVRRQFGVVLQESAVFSGTIAQNIRLNDPKLDMEQVIKAARLAALHDDIMKMPMNYETHVGEGGSSLSGGQRQRLAIARAIAHRPAILLFDEATSALDIATEQRVASNMQSLACTQIIIAHRLSTICTADLILVLENGTIVEQGTHEQLAARGGAYSNLIQYQIEREETRPMSAISVKG